MANDKPGRTVTVIGLGNMGSALAEALLSAGFSVTVWNRTASKVLPLLRLGAETARNAYEAVRASDISIVCVADFESTFSIIQDDAVIKELRGKTLAQLGVITADQSRQIASWASKRNINYLECSIMGLPNDVRNTTATPICSGSKETFDSNKDILMAFGAPEYVSVETGAAYNFDKSYYLFGYAVVQGFVQGAALAYASGFPIETYTRVVTGHMSVYQDRFKHLGSMIADRRFEGNQATMEEWERSFAGSLNLCRELGVDDTLPTALMRNFQRAVIRGCREKEISALFETLVPLEKSRGDT